VGADQILERVTLPDGQEMVLTRWDDNITIFVGKRPLMSNFEHGSEDEFGRIVAERLVAAGIKKPRMLIGGLGLGFTLRAAPDVLPADARVTVPELVPAGVKGTPPEHGAGAGPPPEDPGGTPKGGDFAKVIAQKTRYHAILLDVDNGPDALTHKDNANLYKRAGLGRARTALTDDGLLAVWSAFPSRTFTTWLKDSGFDVEQLRAAPMSPGGPRYYIWLARRR